MIPGIEKLAYAVVGDCHIYAGPRMKNGYGRVNLGPDRPYAHRLSYEIHKGPIPEGHTIDHLCEVKLCINPEHLEAVPQSENAARYWRNHPAGPMGDRGACAQGHPMTEGNTYSPPSRPALRRCKACRLEWKRAWRSQRREEGLSPC